MNDAEMAGTKNFCPGTGVTRPTKVTFDVKMELCQRSVCFTASISIEDGGVFEGSLPPKQLKMVQTWIEIHKEELMVDWELAVNGEDTFRIAPLQ